MLLRLILFLISEVSLIITTPPLVYHNEMSEYCRRQVVPSIFLSRQVTKVNSHILHFSKLELPYTCHISVRTEPSNNLILVSEILSNHDLKETCSKNPNQLTVYEMSETFGGYWGPLPDNLFRQGYPATTKYYTLKTTPSTLATTTEENTPITENQKTSTFLKVTDALTTDEDFVTIEMPLVNVSGRFVLGQSAGKGNMDAEHLFELLYDVTSGLTYPGFTYRTKQGRPWQKQKYNANRRLNFKKNNLFSKNQRTNTTFHKHRYTSIPHALLTNKYRNEYTSMKNNINTKYPMILNKTKQIKLSVNKESWKIIEDLMKTLNKNVNFGVTAPMNFSILQKISDPKHNFSAHLLPNLSIYDNNTWDGLTPSSVRIFNYSKTNLKEIYRPIKITNTISTKKLFTKKLSTRIAVTKADTESIHLNKTSEMSPDLKNSIFHIHKENNTAILLQQNVSAFSNSTKPSFRKVIVNDDKSIFDGVNLTTASTDLKITTAERIQFDTSYSSRKPKLSGLLVDHESWENIVQSAPEMVVLLNETRDDDSGHVNKTKRRRKKRKRRTIHAIAIENSPRSLTTKTTVATSKITFNIGDMQEFAQLVELKDDELHDRVVLRDMTKFSGPVLYNICDSQGAAGRGVVLFNASRIVLVLNNFSLQGLTVILTPSRTLLTGDSYCSTTNIECQVSGTRVCIDSLASCDGIPNCGSYDIYDEDPLVCGSSARMLRNVYLAAITSLALILTVFYIVHYWLKQYVPKVSEAFFIYINGVENILYLDSIMRNPNESEENDITKLYDGNIFNDDMLYSTDIKTNKIKLFKFFKKIFTFDCLWKKRPVQDDILFSAFPETELRYMKKQDVTETAVQTGSSLEIGRFTLLMNKENEHSHKKLELPPILETEISPSLMAMLESTSLFENHSEELNILKLFRKSRSDSIESISYDTLKQLKDLRAKSSVTTLEKEIVTHEYDGSALEAAGPSTRNDNFNDLYEIPHIKKTTKQLMFDDETTIIPSMEFKDAENDSSENNGCRRAIDFGKTKGSVSNKSSIAGRSFWGKSKKQKKRM